MKFTARRTRALAGLCLAAGAAAMAPSTATAGVLQDTIFAQAVQASQPRLFFKLSVISAHVRTTSKDAQDVTGPVLARSDFENYLFTNSFVSGFQTKAASLDTPKVAESLEQLYSPDSPYVATSFFGILDSEYSYSGCQAIQQGLGTPCGIKVKSSATVGTMAVSLGYQFDEARNWQVEAYILAAPIATSVYGDGLNQLRGKKIIETKLLPPIVTIGRQFGQPGQIRPYAGWGVSYAVFFDTQATGTLNSYQGGSGPQDTVVRIHNAWGTGPFAGMSYGASDAGWHFGFTVGRLRFKPETTLTTYNTRITSDSLVLRDFGAKASSALVGAERIYATTKPDSAITVKATNTPEGFTAGQVVPLTTALMCDLARAKNNRNDCNLGTFERRASTTLDTTMFMLTVGRNF